LNEQSHVDMSMSIHVIICNETNFVVFIVIQSGCTYAE